MSKDSFICTKVGLIPLLERKAVTASCPFVHNMLLYSSSFSPFFPRYRGPEKKEENYRSICRARRSLPNTSCFTLLLFSTCTLLRLTENLCYLQHLYEHVEYTSHFLLQYNTNITHVSVLLVTNSQLLTIQIAKSCLQHHNDGIMIIIDTLRDNHLTRHLSICLTEITKKTSAVIMCLFTSWWWQFHRFWHTTGKRLPESLTVLEVKCAKEGYNYGSQNF